MERLKDMPGQEIMPQDLQECYVKARGRTYASGKEPILGLNIPGFKGYKEELYPYFYQDNYVDDKRRPGNFRGLERISEQSFEGNMLALYAYVGGLTREGLKLGEEAVYGRLVKILGEHVRDVCFGKTVTFDFEDGLGKWVYEGNGSVGSYGWEDDESISLNGIQMYKLRGTGLSFIKGF